MRCSTASHRWKPGSPKEKERHREKQTNRDREQSQRDRNREKGSGGGGGGRDPEGERSGREVATLEIHLEHRDRVPNVTCDL